MTKHEKNLVVARDPVPDDQPLPPTEAVKEPKRRISEEALALVERLPELWDKGWVRRNRAPTAKIKYDDETLVLEVQGHAKTDDAAQLIFRASLGSTDEAFSEGLMSQLVNSCSGWEKADPKAFGFALAVIQGIEPRDEIEAMLAAQMAVIHTAAMRFGRNLVCAETLEQRDSCERTLNKLSRTFATQMEALKRYRTGGEQKVTVQHVTANDGGQAMVGTVNARGARKSER